MPIVILRFAQSTSIYCFVFILLNHAMSYAQTPTRYLALGDSYTIGEGVDEQDRWPVILAHQLGISTPTIIAKTGWTTDELQAEINKSNPDKNYSLVSLLIGVNNQYRGYNLDDYRKEFTQLLQQAISFAGNDPGRVFVVSIPDYGATPFAAEKNPRKISEEIDLYNAINKKITAAVGVQYFDITPISREAAHEESLLTDDHLHPSGKMYQRWVDSFSQQVKTMLKP